VRRAYIVDIIIYIYSWCWYKIWSVFSTHRTFMWSCNL